MSIKNLEKLQKFVDSDNIASMLSKHKLNEISQEVIRGLEEDELSVKEWRKNAARALKLTDLSREPKHTPMRDASNVKYPIITTAVIQFSARTLPELIKSGEVVKYRVIGRDNSGAKRRLGERLKSHLNYQILEAIPNWLDERDRLLTHLGVVGTAYTKTWFDPIQGLNRSELIPYDEIVVNDNIKSLEECERISHIITLTMNEIVEHIRFGLFREVPNDIYSKDSDKSINPQELIEQHCFLDLDDDDYKEPYVVTVHRSSGEVLRVVARYTMDSVVANTTTGEVLKIFGQNFFNDYHFIPNPTGRFHSIGFGTLLLDMNESVNTILNQLIDAGRLANLQGGFIGSGMRMRKKTIEHEPGEWVPVQTMSGEPIGNNIYELKYHEPSLVLFQLLGTLIQSAQALTSSTDALTGVEQAQNTSPNTLLALIQQGLKVFTAIQRRIFRGFKKELIKMVDLNRLYLDPQEYLRIVDPKEEEIPEIIDPQSGQIMDYLNAGVDVVPVADINTATEAENLIKSQSMLQAATQLAATGVVDMREAAMEYFRALELPNVDRLVPPPNPAPNPQIIKLQSDIDKVAKDLELREQELHISAAEAEARIKKMATESIKNIADAENAKTGLQLEAYKTYFDKLLAEKTLNVKAGLEKPMDEKSALIAKAKSKGFQVVGE